MTKNEAAELGTKLGTEWAAAESLPVSFAVKPSEQEVHFARVAEEGRLPRMSAPALAAFGEAFAKAALAGWWARYNDLPEVVAEWEARHFVRRVDALCGAQETVDKFAERLAKDPVYAFEWADGAMQAAAEVALGQRVRAMLDGGAGVPQVLAHLRRELMDLAGRVASSTSACSNRMADYKRAAVAGLLSGL